MNYNVKNRFIVFGGVALLFFIVLVVQLIQLMLVKGAEYAAEAAAPKTREIAISGARGSILDRNGLPLAYDQKAFNVQFYRDPMRNKDTDRAFYTAIIIETIDIIERNGGKTVDTFAIYHDEETDEYGFEWGITNEAFVAEREKTGVPTWRGLNRTPEEIYLFLRNKYQIPAEMCYEDAGKCFQSGRTFSCFMGRLQTR